MLLAYVCGLLVLLFITANDNDNKQRRLCLLFVLSVTCFVQNNELEIGNRMMIIIVDRIVVELI